jgi:hypothetical protein
MVHVGIIHIWQDSCFTENLVLVTTYELRLPKAVVLEQCGSSVQTLLRLKLETQALRNWITVFHRFFFPNVPGLGIFRKKQLNIFKW